MRDNEIFSESYKGFIISNEWGGGVNSECVVVGLDGRIKTVGTLEKCRAYIDNTCLQVIEESYRGHTITNEWNDNVFTQFRVVGAYGELSYTGTQEECRAYIDRTSMSTETSLSANPQSGENMSTFPTLEHPQHEPQSVAGLAPSPKTSVYEPTADKNPILRGEIAPSKDEWLAAFEAHLKEQYPILYGNISLNDMGKYALVEYDALKRGWIAAGELIGIKFD